MSKRPEEDPRSYPYQRSFVLLGRDSQVAITSSLIRSLGFEPKLNPSLEGLSGIAHAVPLIGVDPHKRRLLVVQTGAEDIPRFYHEPHHQVSSNIVSSKSPEEARLEWLRKSLFTTLDVKAAIESRGWSCNTLFFFNSLEVPTAAMADKERKQLVAHQPNAKRRRRYLAWRRATDRRTGYGQHPSACYRYGRRIH